ncbi:ubx domain-containing protein [Anaeramoeba flamelloides]|uniref:UBX domain-containing protein 2 n=1 Tax=Anaeramoeba flamelloides TaxID=1746091 RepID=A0ABQ8YH93_9EUKA|nr:ubx domain-containing protein [Anaeramoeba flamelloides]
MSKKSLTKFKKPKSSKNFDRFLMKKKDRNIFVEWSANWCSHCSSIEPYLQTLSLRFDDAIFIKLDIDEFEDLAEKYEVDTIPSFWLFQNGKMKKKLTGIAKEPLTELFQKYIPRKKSEKEKQREREKEKEQEKEQEQEKLIRKKESNQEEVGKGDYQVNPFLLKSLIEMGFNSNFATRALIQTGNTDQLLAIEWMDEMTNNGQEKELSTPIGNETDFSKEQVLERLEKQIENSKKKRQKEVERQKRRKEIERELSGKKYPDEDIKTEEMLRRKTLEKIKKEKKRKKEELKRIKLKMKDDKLHREQLFKKKKLPITNTKNKPKEITYNSCTIKFETKDGETFIGKFSSSQDVRGLYSYIRSQQNSIPYNFKLIDSVPPNRVLGEYEESSLLECGFVPSAKIIVKY